MSYESNDLRRDVLLAINRARVVMTVQEATDVLTQIIAEIGGTLPSPPDGGVENRPAYEEAIRSNITHIGITKVEPSNEKSSQQGQRRRA